MNRQLVVLVIVLVAVFGLIAFFGFAHSDGKAPAGPAGPGNPSIDDAKTKAMLAKLGALVELPKGETPQVIEIQDAATARTTQPFLERAEDGDVLFLYPVAKLAILYRSSTNAIIAEGPLNDGPPPSSGDAVAPAPAR